MVEKWVVDDAMKAVGDLRAETKADGDASANRIDAAFVNLVIVAVVFVSSTKTVKGTKIEDNKCSFVYR